MTNTNHYPSFKRSFFLPLISSSLSILIGSLIVSPPNLLEIIAAGLGAAILQSLVISVLHLLLDDLKTKTASSFLYGVCDVLSYSLICSSILFTPYVAHLFFNINLNVFTASYITGSVTLLLLTPLVALLGNVYHYFANYGDSNDTPPLSNVVSYT